MGAQQKSYPISFLYIITPPPWTLRLRLGPSAAPADQPAAKMRTFATMPHLSGTEDELSVIFTSRIPEVDPISDQFFQIRHLLSYLPRARESLRASNALNMSFIFLHPHNSMWIRKSRLALKKCFILNVFTCVLFLLFLL